MVDEKAVRNHHGYVAFVLNAATGEPLHCAEGINANDNATRDEIRRQSWHEAAKADKSGIKGQRYNRFAWKGTLRDKPQAELDKLLAANAPISEAYVLGDQLRTIW